ncbi:MAG: NBR1-Ig-like domain-containing protein, partial [Umezawaea sp.]
VGAVVLARPAAPQVDPGARVVGDSATFVGDVTVPDGMEIHLGQSVLKVWDIANSGSVQWHDRYLERMDLPEGPDTCGTPDRVPVGDTAPGEHAMISVMLRARTSPGRCWVGWKMIDTDGAQFFPSRRPVYVLVNVVP